MASEVEAKYWVRKPSRRVSNVLNLEDITEYNIGTLRKRARDIAGKPEYHTLIDNVYIKTDMTKGYTAANLEKKIKLEKGGSNDEEEYDIRYGKNILRISVEDGKDIDKEYKGFMKHLQTYFAGRDKKTPKDDQPNKYALRIRRDETTKTTYMTLKCKHGKADEKSEEYEFIVQSRKEAEKFVHALGYERQPERTKTKEQEKYSVRNNGTTTSIEFNKVAGLGRTPILEIEVVSKSLKKSPSIKYIFEVAEKLGIKNPEKDTENGGNLEPRGYGRLLKIVNNGNGYKK